MFSQTEAPKREMRAAWLSTVRNIDWPSNPSNSTEKKIADLISIIDDLKDANLNTVIMQVRPACDAMYASTIEPWSYWLTGEQGRAPSPFFDPLEIAIEESHKRGMELHAWLNPYRVRLESYNLALDETNIAKQHPEWVLKIDGDEILDPGIPEVRQHIVNVINDIITRYDVDAIHFDDYFYLSGITDEDAETFATYPNGFTNLGDWRRDNVNELMRMIYAQIQAVNPRVKFGQSPAGIWKSGIPDGTWGNNNYSVLYCDAVTWFNEKTIDYLAPQLYWPFGGGQDYGKLATWWGSVSNERHVYPGLPFYRIFSTSAPINDASQIGKMVSLNRKLSTVQGEVYFTSLDFRDNNGGVTDTLKNKYYKYPALVPTMDWKDTDVPNNPSNIRFDRVNGIGTTALTWDIPTNEDIKFYVLYRSENSNFNISDLSDPKNIFKITSNNYVQIDEDFPTGNAFYYVTALDWNNNESTSSERIEFQPSIVLPDVPSLLLPLSADAGIKDTVDLVWNYAPNANSYTLELSTLEVDGVSDSLVFTQSEILDTTYQITGLIGEKEYFWSVKSVNLAGESEFAEDYSFTTAFPATPILQTPLFQEIDVNLNPLFSWKDNPKSESYHFRLAEGRGISTETTIVDTVLTATSFSTNQLKPGTFYAWSVSSKNEYGNSLWATMFQFKTIIVLPEAPQLIAPANLLDTLGDSVTFVWQGDSISEDFRLQVSTDESFTKIVFDVNNIMDTTLTLGEFEGASTYYWRVRANNNGGSSSYSDAYSFSTGFPILPILVYPEYQQVGVEVDPTIIWNKAKLANGYKLQLSEGLGLNLDALVIDTLVTDSSLYYRKFEVNTFYAWRVKALNSIGESDWTEIFQFKTSADTTLAAEDELLGIPEEYALEQNYPNPFNPATTISFSLPEAGLTKLTVYNIIGQEIAVLISDYLSAGVYKVSFNASSQSKSVTSGLYLYKLESKDFISIKKMLLIK